MKPIIIAALLALTLTGCAHDIEKYRIANGYSDTPIGHKLAREDYAKMVGRVFGRSFERGLDGAVSKSIRSHGRTRSWKSKTTLRSGRTIRSQTTYRSRWGRPTITTKYY